MFNDMNPMVDVSINKRKTWLKASLVNLAK